MLSRHMPATPEHKVSPLAYAVLLAFGLGIVYLCWRIPFVIAVVASIALLSWVVWIFERKRLAKLSANRHEDSICTFARSFDCRHVDTQIIRAVYEELQSYLSDSHDKFPIRASDRIDEDLRIDREDLDDIAYDIAARAGCDMANTKANPLFDKVNTVADMVLFFAHQTRIGGTEQGTAPAAVYVSPGEH